MYFPQQGPGGLHPATSILSTCDCYEIEWFSQATPEREHVLFVHRNFISSRRKKKKGTREQESENMHPYKLLLKNLSPTGLQQTLLPHFFYLHAYLWPHCLPSRHIDLHFRDSSPSVTWCSRINHIIVRLLPAFRSLCCQCHGKQQHNLKFKVKTWPIYTHHKPSGRFLSWEVLFLGFACPLWLKAKSKLQSRFQKALSKCLGARTIPKNHEPKIHFHIPRSTLRVISITCLFQLHSTVWRSPGLWHIPAPVC